MSSVVTWYEGDLVVKTCKTFWVTPPGTCRGLSSAPKGLAQDLQRATVTRGLAAGPDRFDGRSRYNSLSPSECPSSWLATGEEPTATILKEHVQLKEIFSL